MGKAQTWSGLRVQFLPNTPYRIIFQPLVEPVSFADIFGCMVGETLLGKQNMKVKLSNFRTRLSDFKHPMFRG